MRQTCFRAPSIVMAGVGATLLFAPPAAADDADYLHSLRGRWASLSDQQLLTEGRKICNATRSGTNSGDAMLMVQKDLQMGVPEAMQVVKSAVVSLGC